MLKIVFLSRSDGSLEIWDISYAAFLEKCIPGDGKLSIEGIGWAGDRLFSAGLNGEVVEWDLTALRRKASQRVTGLAIWCLDINRTGSCMAVGTEEGYLNAFDIDENGITYKNLFDKQEGRILCCRFDATGDYIVTGSIDVIRIWNTKTGHAIHRMALGRSEKKRETIVWSLQVTKAFFIIAGDSRGQITVWDGKLGAQVESHQVLQADVLAVAINEEEDVLVCSGMDPIIRIYSLTEIKKNDRLTKKWVKFFQRNVHDHDVKALVCVGSDLISGGVDGYLGISSYAKTGQSHIAKHGPFLQSPCAAISPEARLLLLQYVTGLDVWRLGSALDRVQITDEESKDHRKILSLDAGPEQLIQLQSVNHEAIVCSALSPNGRFLVYSTTKSIRIFVITAPPGQPVKLTRIKDLPESCSACSKILFSRDSSTLFLVKPGVNHIDVFNILSDYEIDYCETIDALRAIRDVIHLLTISHCGRYLVAAGTCRTIAVWQKMQKHWDHYFNLPKYMVPTTAIALHYAKPRLVAAFTDGKIFEYDLDEMAFTCSSNKKFFSTCQTHSVNNIVLCNNNENIFILHNDKMLYVLEKQPSEERNSIKTAKSDGSKNTADLKLKYQKSFEVT